MRNPANYSVKKRSLIAAALNLVIFIAQLLCVCSFWDKGGEGNMQLYGFELFMFFTVDSNVFCAIACLCLVPYEVRKALKPQTRVPKWAILFKFMGTVTVTLTFLVVAVFLGPVTGDYWGMFTGSNLHMHLLGPLMAMAGFCMFEDYEYLKKSRRLLPLIPVLIYAAVYAVMVLVIGSENGGWSDFYHFNMGGMWYISLLAIVAVTAAVSLGEYALNQRRFRNVR